MLKSYKYRMLPTEKQKAIFENWFGACRFVYNIGIEVKKAAWSSLRVTISNYDLMKQLTDLKRTECKWLAECPAQSLESSLTNLDKAYTKFFKGGGFPNFKKRTNRQSIIFRKNSKIIGSQIKLTKIGFVDFIQHRPLGKGEIRTVTVSKTPSGKYFVSILVRDEKEIPLKKKIKEKTSVGVDVGLKTFATLSDGQKFENPKYLRKQLKRLKKEQRKIARRYKKGVAISEQSKGWHKQKLVVAKLHEKIANQRADFLHKTSTAIVKQYNTICVENLNVSGMMQNRKLSKAISDVSWYEFNRMLEYKAEWYGKNIIRIGRFEPSSKSCFNCGEINTVLKLLDRDWVCGSCGSYHDRDENAAKNIKKIGLETKPSIANVGQ